MAEEGTSTGSGNSSSSDDRWVFPMLDAISNRPELWDLSNERYRLVHTAKKESWKQVADYVKEVSGIEKTVEVLKTRWTTVSKAYKAERRKRPPTGSEGGERKRSKYASALSFLDDRPVHRQTTTNVAPETEPALDDGQNNYTSEPVADLEESSTVTKRSRSRSSGANTSNDTDERIVSILERSLDTQKESRATRYDEYGKIVVRILNARPQALRELLDWISRNESYGDDDDQYSE